MFGPRNGTDRGVFMSLLEACGDRESAHDSRFADVDVRVVASTGVDGDATAGVGLDNRRRSDSGGADGHDNHEESNQHGCPPGTDGEPVDGCRPAYVTPRRARAVLTPSRADCIAAVWPEVSARLTAFARKWTKCGADAEDLVQEVAARLLRSDEVTFVDADDLMRWCQRVARNLLIDEHRTHSKTCLVPLAEELQDISAGTDVAYEVEQRHRLRRVGAALALMAERDRNSLYAAALGDESPAQSRRDAVRQDVARHRARQRLLAALGGSYGTAVCWVRRGRLRYINPQLAAVAAMPALAVLVLSLSPDVHPSAPHWSSPPSMLERAVVAVPREVQIAPVTRSGPKLVPRSYRSPSPRPAPAAPTVLRVGNSGPGVGVSEYEPDDDRLVCIGGLPLVPERCLFKPSRAQGGNLGGFPTGGG